ncbi:hypothetical protein BC834DRAFT_58001 [Gloeopeniophorella convolvens]|nr:hypothetical protein BC834DRAFT_58001 [Gloeopeniophorella convolvens]
MSSLPDIHNPLSSPASHPGDDGPKSPASVESPSFDLPPYPILSARSAHSIEWGATTDLRENDLDQYDGLSHLSPSSPHTRHQNCSTSSVPTFSSASTEHVIAGKASASLSSVRSAAVPAIILPLPTRSRGFPEHEDSTSLEYGQEEDETYSRVPLEPPPSSERPCALKWLFLVCFLRPLKAVRRESMPRHATAALPVDARVSARAARVAEREKQVGRRERAVAQREAEVVRCESALRERKINGRARKLVEVATQTQMSTTEDDFSVAPDSSQLPKEGSVRTAEASVANTNARSSTSSRPSGNTVSTEPSAWYSVKTVSSYKERTQRGLAKRIKAILG